jgi:hypothetical protein
MINSDFLFKINLIYKTTDICSIFNADLSFRQHISVFQLVILEKDPIRYLIQIFQLQYEEDNFKVQNWGNLS